MKKNERKETCKDCKFFRPKSSDPFLASYEDNECRRYSPNKKGEWPYVKEDDWCGEFKVKG